MHIYRESRYFLPIWTPLAGCSQVTRRVTQTGDNVTLLPNAKVTSNMRDIIITPQCSMAELDQQPLKLVFLGDSAVGKTALLRRFNTGFPPEENQAVQIYDFTDCVEVDGKKYHVQFWDVKLLEGYERLRALCYPSTDIFLLCFDNTNRASFDSIKDSWITEIRHHMPYTPFVIVGNKMDLRKNK